MTPRFATALAALGASLPVMALAAETPSTMPATQPAEAPALVEGKLEIKPYAFLENYMIINRTGTAKAPGFESGRTYFGLKAKNGMAGASLETALTGPYRYNSHSHSDNQTVTNTSNTPADVAGKKSDKTDMLDGFLGIRKAEVFLTLPTRTEIHLGRVRTSGADMWGADAIGWSAGAQGFSSVDGLMLRQKLTIDNMKFNAGLAYVNTLVNQNGTPKKGYAPYNYLVTSSNQLWSKADRGIIANVGAELLGFEMRLYYGAEKNQIVEKIDSTTVSVVDYSQIEASLGYNIPVVEGEKLLTVGGWFERDAEGKMTLATMEDNGSGAIKNGKEIRKAYVTTRYGLGVVADGGLVGVNNLLQKDDTILLGLSWESNDQGKLDGITGADKKTQEDKAKQVYTASLGYKAGGLETYFGIKSEATEGKVMKGQDGKVVDSFNTTYMKMAWWFE